ncbi:uncharacterized protein LOC110455336 [Mizuhopecten yessoensis]|uniref:uncharacterized protein LOC110455336 n=1 Tax=Mizuhopecten yessoensis TaxID=6573 RepID=UPI000B45E5DB|nr:uncharacterized protein LOC110455336 [Mizuhopecten yessoensis]
MSGIARRILDSLFQENANRKLTHEVFGTLMAEVCAIINARPLVPVSTDADDPFVLTPAILLTQTTGSPAAFYDHLDVKDMYRTSWRHVQVMAERFWNRWRKDYLSTLQTRRKWHQECDNVKTGYVVLLKDRNVPRNDWPLGVILRVFPSDDGLVRKAEVKVVRGDKTATYIRPIIETIPLIQ